MSQSEYIYFADCEIDVAGFALRRKGEVCELEPQVLELLLFLARNPDRLMTKDDLIANVWHGRIVSDTTITSRIKSARQAIGDDGTQQKLIRTVHGRGVRFIAAVRTELPGASRAPRHRSRCWRAPARRRRIPTLKRNWPAIAVLPFTNLGGDDDQDYFADGVTEDIITDLSRFRELRVVARDSCFQHRTPGADLQQVGRALNADYVVTGSIRRRGSKLRLSRAADPDRERQPGVGGALRPRRRGRVRDGGRAGAHHRRHAGGPRAPGRLGAGAAQAAGQSRGL